MPASDKQPSTDFVPWLAEHTHGNARGVTGLQQDPTVTGWIEPSLINGYASPGAPMTPVAYRLHTKTQALEFRGHIDAANATSGEIAFYIIQPFWHPHDISYLTDIQTDLLGSFNSCRVHISSVDGAVTLTWPAT